MSRLITASERIVKARTLIDQARKLERSQEDPWQDFSYAAQVKDLMRQGRELIKFIGYTSGISEEIKEEAKVVFTELDQTEQELLHRK
jgi:23S rRNA pseudoU1915 N3-methylase RlmH